MKGPTLTCRNCHALLPSPPSPAHFCPNCGQETSLHPPTVLDFARQFGGNYIALKGTLWRTLACLLFKPGHLTLEWLAGRRRRYVLPFRLYLSLALVFFFLLQLTAAPTEQDGAVQVQVQPPEINRVVVELGSQHWGWLDPIRPVAVARIDAARKRLERDGAGAFGQRVLRGLITALYYALFVWIPLQAAMLWLLFRSAGRNYGEHLLFMLNRSSAVLLFMLMIMASRWTGLSFLIVVWLLINAEREMRAVYGQLARVLWRRTLLLGLQLLVALPLVQLLLLYSVLI